MLERLKQLHKKAVLQLVGVCVRAAVPLLAATVVFTGLLLYYAATHISINTDTGEMLDPNLPFRRAGRQFDAAFPQLSGEIVVIAEADHAGDAEDATDRLAAELRKHPDTVQSVYQPGAGDYFATHGLLYLDTQELWTLDDRLAEAQPFLGTLARDPSLRGLFTAMGKAFAGDISIGEQKLLVKMFDRIGGTIEQQLAGKPQQVHWRDEVFKGKKSGGSRRYFILVKPAVDYSRLQPAEEALELVHTLARQIDKPDIGLRVRVTGSVAMDSEELVTVSRDAKLTTVLSFGLVCVLLIWGLRSPGPVVAVLITLTCGLVWTAAFATWAIGSLNLISVSFAVLFIGMGVDFGIQFAMRYLEACDRGLAKVPALQAAAAGVGGALTLAAAGAAISFFSFVPTSYRGLAELGIISGFSMFVALLANLTILPALLGLMRVPALRVRLHNADSTQSVEDFVCRHRRLVLAVTLLTIGASLALLPRAHFDFNPLNLKDQTTESVATFRDLAGDPDSTPYTIEALADSLAAARQTAARLDKLSVVDKTVTFANYVPDGQDEKLQIIEGMRSSLQSLLTPPAADPAPTVGGQAAAIRAFHDKLTRARSSTSDPAFAAGMARLEGALNRLEAAPGWPDRTLHELQTLLLGDLDKTLSRLRQLLKAEPVSLTDLPQDLRERYVAADGRARIEVYPKENLGDNQALRRFVLAVQGVVPEATDSPVELLEGSEAVIRACIQAAALALLLTIIMHIVVLHGVLDALLVAAPLVLAMLLTVATSVLFKIPFNFANIIALPLLIGLNNAYGAYLVIRRHTESGIVQLLQSSTPRAVLFSGLTSISSFGVLAVSTHPGMAGMGVLISLSLTYAVICALVVLPAIMAELDARPATRTRVVAN